MRERNATPEDELFMYGEGTPEWTGIYACRVPHDTNHKMWTDIFLLFDADLERWYYPGSDQGYRAPVPYWLGPLQRRMG